MKERKVTGKPAEPMQGVVEVSPDVRGDRFLDDRAWGMNARHVVDAQTGQAHFLVRVGDEAHLVDEIVVGNVTYRAVNYEVSFILEE